MDRKRYPPDWDDISRYIRFERAGGRCEACGARHGAEIIRSSRDSARFVVIGDDGGYYWPNGEHIRASELPGEFEDSPETVKRVVLTTHHIGVPREDGTPGDPEDKMDCRPENLIALCQACHLAAERPENIAKAVRTRVRRKHERIADTGQQQLFD